MATHQPPNWNALANRKHQLLHGDDFRRHASGMRRYFLNLPPHGVDLRKRIAMAESQFGMTLKSL